MGSTLVLLLLVSVLRGPASDDAIPWDGPGAGHRARLDAPIPVVPGNLRVLLIGDSVGLTQGTAVNTPGVTMINAARAGCGLVPYTSSRTTGTLGWNGQPGGCAGIAADWEAGLAQKPDVVVLVAGAWEVYDRRIGTTTYRVYQDHYAQLIHERLDDIRAFFSKRADVPLVIEDVPCMRPTNADVGASDNPRADDRRTAWVNSVFASYASRHPGGVAVLHVSDFTCPDGEFKRSVDGNVIRYDGVHYDPKVTSRLWATLLPRLLKLPGVTVHHPLDAEPSPSD